VIERELKKVEREIRTKEGRKRDRELKKVEREIEN
jgi:hypothetical protein